jgi:hypothetical protein
MTALSYHRVESSTKLRVFSLARGSLPALGMLFASGCIVADPPLYEEPPPTPPVFDLNRAEPNVSQVVVLDRSVSRVTLREFRVPFRSDDKGQRVRAALHIDWGATEARESFVVNTDVSPSTFDDTSRELLLPLRQNDVGFLTPGCHTLTIIAAHDDNWDKLENRPIPAQAEDDTAMVTWWANVVDRPEIDPYTLINCPRALEGMP